MSNVKQLKDASGNSFSPKTSIDALTSTGVGGKFLVTSELGVEESKFSVTNVPQITGTTEAGHFASFDANGGIKDSGYNESTFIKGVKQNGTLITPVSGVVDVTVQDGASAYDLYVDSLPAGTTPLSPEAWLASLKANIGAFKFVSYDSSAGSDFTTNGIGTTYSSTIDGLRAGTDTTPDVILLMNNADGTTTPTKTFMIATQEVTPATTPATYEFVYAGNLQDAMPNNVVTTDKIDNAFAGGSGKVASADETKILRDDVVTKIDGTVSPLILQNLFDKDSSFNLVGFCLNSSGEVVEDSNFVVSHYIPVLGGHTYIGGTSIYYCAIYDKYKNQLSIQTTLDTSTSKAIIPSNGCYLRFSHVLTNIDNVYVSELSVSSGNQPYGQLRKDLIDSFSLKDNSVTSPKIADNAVTLSKLSFSETSPNLINTNDQDYALNKELTVGGSITPKPEEQNKATTGYIPVIAGDKYVQSYNGVSNSTNVVCFYRTNKTYLSIITNGDNPFTIPENAAYIRVTSNYKKDRDHWQIEHGETVTPYKKYGSYISEEYLELEPTINKCNTYTDNKIDSLKDELEESESIDVCIPSIIYSVADETMQLFYKSIFKCINPYNYNIQVELKENGTNTNVKYDASNYAVCPYPRYIEIKMPATSVGHTYSLIVTIKDKNNKILGTKTSSLLVASQPQSPSSQTNILIVGDSTPRNGVMPNELQRRLIGVGGTPTGNNLSNIALVGRQVGTSSGSTAHIECGGTNFSSYTSQDESNPFYHNGAIDMDWYVNTYCNRKVDIILTTLFSNGATSYGKNVATLISNMATFINQCRSSSTLANVKFGIGLEFNYDIHGGLGDNYGTFVQDWNNWYGTSWTHFEILKALEKWITDNNAGDYVFILNLLNEFDCENGYNQKMKKLNTRMPDNPVTNVVEQVKEPFGNNGVHPHEYGRKMFADTAWRLIVSKFCQHNE